MEKKIFLLADDDIDDREMFCEALKAIDSDVVCHVVADGREALDILNSLTEQPQLIFLDVNMPVINGWQCLGQLKEDERYNAIPVIVISTSSHQREMEIAKKLDALCYFTKPNHFDELINVLEIIVKNLGPGLPQALQDQGGNASQYIHVLLSGK